MNLSLSTLLSLSVFLPVIWPSAVNNNNINNIVASDKINFADLPVEIRALIFSYAPDAYDAFFRAFPHYEGYSPIEMDILMGGISEKLPTLKILNETSHMALRLSSPVPLDPENPDITKIDPSSILKWFRYFEARVGAGATKNYGAALYYFAKSPHFSEWYSRWTVRDKREFGSHMATALIFAQKFEDAYKLLDKKVDHKALSLMLFSACLKDDPEYLKEKLDEIRTYHPLDSLLIVTAAIQANAMKIVTSYEDFLLKDFSLSISFAVNEALKLKDDEIFNYLFKLYLQFKYNRDVEVLKGALISGVNLPSRLPIILPRMKFDYMGDEDTLFCFKTLIDKRNINGYKMLFDSINSFYPSGLTAVAPQLIVYALSAKEEGFLKKLATKRGVDHGYILTTLRNMPPKSRKDIPLEYLLTTVDDELPIIGSYDFMEDELITFLIEGESDKGCEIALSKNSQGERKYPLVRVTFEHVSLAIEKCPSCLLFFPSDLVEDFIEKNPKCFTKNYKVFSVLTSALNGEPRFSAMTKYWNIEYLQKITMDERSGEFDLFVQHPPAWLDGETIESMFGLLQFTPELNAALNKRLIGSKRSFNGNIKYYATQSLVLHFLLSKKRDGSPQFSTFEFTKNILFEDGFQAFFPEMLQSYRGNLNYGLSLTSLDEYGNERHFLFELPKITTNKAVIQSCVDVLLDNDGYGNFVLKGINKDLVRAAADKNVFNRERWYSLMLLKKLETLEPPFVEKEI